MRLFGLLIAAALAASGTSLHAATGINLELTKYAVETGIFNTILAKELCSCVFLDGLALDQCKARDNLPAAAHALVSLKIDKNKRTLTSKFNAVAAAAKFAGVKPGPAAQAKFVSQQYGCVLQDLPPDP